MLNHLANCSNVNKISLNVKEADTVISKSNQKKLEGDLKKICGKKLNPTECVKYVGVKIDTNLTWQHHVNDLSIKLNRALIAKLQNMFHSYLSDCCLV